MVGDFPLEQWTEAFSKSNMKFNDNSWKQKTIQQKCSEDDGEPCRFLRAMGTGLIVVGYVCIFDKCVKRYPTEQELEILT